MIHKDAEVMLVKIIGYLRSLERVLVKIFAPVAPDRANEHEDGLSLAFGLSEALLRVLQIPDLRAMMMVSVGSVNTYPGGEATGQENQNDGAWSFSPTSQLNKLLKN
jgi:hypothetical protein